jgi:hypothetical protein
MQLVERRNKHSKIIIINLFASSRSSPNSVWKTPNFSLFYYWMNPMRSVSLRLRRRYNKNRAIVNLRSIADHCACTTAWSQPSCSFDRPDRTGDVIKVTKSCIRSSPQLQRRLIFHWCRSSRLSMYTAVLQISVHSSFRSTVAWSIERALSTIVRVSCSAAPFCSGGIWHGESVRTVLF